MVNGAQVIEVLDTTLRDGEQMQDMSYTPGEKLPERGEQLDGAQDMTVEQATQRLLQPAEVAEVSSAEWRKRRGQEAPR